MASAKNKWGKTLADTTLRRDILDQSDLSIHIICNRITEDYISLIRTHVFPKLSNAKDIKLRELRVLGAIYNWQGQITASQISEILRCDPATVTRAIARLGEMGMVERKSDVFDHRTINIMMTNDGEVLAKDYMDRFSVAVEELSALQDIEIDENEYRQFIRTLSKVSQRVSNMRRIKIIPRKE